MSKQRTTDPAKTKRVFKNAADKARQKRLDGADTEFQNALRYNEARNQTPFNFKGLSYAARTLPAPPGVKRATRNIGGPGLPTPGTIPKITPIKKTPVNAPIVETPGTLSTKRNKLKRSNRLFNVPTNARLTRNITPTGTNRRGGGRTNTKTGLLKR